MNYTISKPKPPIVVILLGMAVLVGLCAMFLAAYAAFGQIMPFPQNVFAAALIEVGLVVEAIAFSRGKNWLAFVGLFVGVLVSGSYNYVQAEKAGTGLNSLLLLAMALGPLSSLSFLAMTFGKELEKFEALVKKWESDRQVWVDAQIEKDNRRKDRQMARQLEQQNRQLSGNFPNTESATKTSDWRKLTLNEKQTIVSMKPSEIMRVYPISDRTSRNWKTMALEELKSNDNPSN